MDLRRLPPPDAERRFGRRASDGELQARYHTAAFVAQVAGLSLPAGSRIGAYGVAPPTAPAGFVADLTA